MAAQVPVSFQRAELDDDAATPSDEGATRAEHVALNVHHVPDTVASTGGARGNLEISGSDTESSGAVTGRDGNVAPLDALRNDPWLLCRKRRGGVSIMGSLFLTSGHHLKVRISPAYLIGFIVVIWGCYAVYTILAPLLFSFVVLPKTAAGHFNDLMELTLRVALTFVFGRNEALVRRPSAWGYLVVVLVSSTVFGWLNHHPALQNTLVSPSAYETPALYVYVVSFALILGVLLVSLRHAATAKELAGQVTFLAFIVAAYVVGSALRYAWTVVGEWHPHHYELAFHLTLLLRYDSAACNMLTSVCLGVLVQGVAAFGALPVMYDSTRSV